MKKEQAKKDYSSDEIVKVVESLGSEGCKSGTNGELIFQTVCHHKTGGSYKLYYYAESHLFHCYTDCGDSFDIYELVAKNKGYDFKQSLAYINNLLGIKQTKRIGFIKSGAITDDWEIINKYSAKEKQVVDFSCQHLPQSLIQYYQSIHPLEWISEGIVEETLRKFNIRYDLTSNKIIIPHYDIQGNLIGIRGRALNTEDIIQGKKYMPMTLQGDIFRHPTAYNLYGLNINQGAIKKNKKIMLFEAEKSVLKCDGFYGSGNFTVACCGSNISNYQKNLILSLGVKEVFLALDKEYYEAFTEKSDAYSEKILNLAYKFTPYATTYVLWDVDNLLDYKDAPCDKGKEILERLMKTKFEVQTQGGND